MRTEFRGASIFFSRIGDCLDPRLLRFTINGAYLRAHMMTGSSFQNASSLNEASLGAAG